MLELWWETHLCYDSYIFLEARIRLALNLDVFLLLTWAIWLEINIDSAFGVSSCADIL